MKMDEQLKQRVLQVGQMLTTVEIGPEFWDHSNPVWQNTNNHVFLIMRHTYQQVEYDDEFKQTFGAVLDKMVWLFVTHPEWRARISWMTWFVQLYVFDKQMVKESLRMSPEVWTDPRHWAMAETTETGLQIGVETIDDSVGGLGTSGSH